MIGVCSAVAVSGAILGFAIPAVSARVGAVLAIVGSAFSPSNPRSCPPACPTTFPANANFSGEKSGVCAAEAYCSNVRFAPPSIPPTSVFSNLVGKIS